MVVGEHAMQVFEVVVVVVVVFIPTSAHSMLFLDKWFVHIYMKILAVSILH